MLLFGVGGILLELQCKLCVLSLSARWTGSLCTGLPLSFCISNDTLTSKARLCSPVMFRHSVARVHCNAVLHKHQVEGDKLSMLPLKSHCSQICAQGRVEAAWIVNDALLNADRRENCERHQVEGTVPFAA